MGLTVSDAVRLLLTKVAKEKALPFDIWQPNAETIAAMEEDLSKAKCFTSVKRNSDSASISEGATSWIIIYLMTSFLRLKNIGIYTSFGEYFDVGFVYLSY